MITVTVLRSLVILLFGHLFFSIYHSFYQILISLNFSLYFTFWCCGSVFCRKLLLLTMLTVLRKIQEIWLLDFLIEFPTFPASAVIFLSIRKIIVENYRGNVWSINFLWILEVLNDGGFSINLWVFFWYLTGQFLNLVV